MIDRKNIIRIIGKIIKIYSGSDVPLRVAQYLTYRCNLNCGFCARNSIKSEELNTKQIISCIKEFRSLGTEFWGFNGGEPLLREDIGNLISVCRKLNMRTSMSTNGILIPERMNDIRDLDLISVSIDGPEAIHNKIRGETAYQRTITGIETLQRNNKKFIIVSVINQDNLLYLGEILKIAEYYNCPCEFQPIFMHRSDIQKKAVKYIPSQMRDVAEYLIRQKKSGRPVANSYSFLNKIKEYPNSKGGYCWAKRFFCVITPNGMVYLCCVIISDENLYNSGIEIGWKNAYRALIEMKDCKGCFLFDYSEYNLILDRPLSSFCRIGMNLLKRTWISA